MLFRSQVTKYALLAERVYVQVKHWKTKDQTYTVCMGKAGAFSFGDSVVADCATKLALSSAQAVVATAGADLSIDQFEIKATDVNDKTTLVPSKLTYQSSDPKKLKVEANGKLTILGTGTVRLNAIDEATGIRSNQVDISLVEPRFNKTELTLKVGEIVTLNLQSPQGQNITHNGLTDWRTNATGVVSGGIVAIYPNGIAMPQSPATSIQIKGLKEGSTTIAGINVASASISGTEIMTVKVVGDFKIEIADVDLRGNVYDCRTLTYLPVLGYQSYVACKVGIDTRVRCTGAGCVKNRFFVAVKNYSAFLTFANTTRTDCAEAFQQPDLIPKISSQYALDEPWVALEPEKFVKPWSLFGVMTPTESIIRDVVMLSGRENEDCLTSSATQTVTFRVYDAANGQYTDFPYNVSVP